MQQQIFTDGIGKISVIGGVVRLDFMVYAPTDPDSQTGQPRQILTHQVLMGVDAFNRAAGQCAEAVKQLQAANQPAPQPKPAPAPQAAQTITAPPKSSAQPMTAAPVEPLSPRKPDASPWTANLKPVAPMRPFP
jgi:hypothetical protein